MTRAAKEFGGGRVDVDETRRVIYDQDRVGTISTSSRTISSMLGAAGASLTDKRVTDASGSSPAQVAGAHQAPLDRIQRGLGSTLQLKLAKDVADVGFHRLLTDVEFARDLFVRLPFREES